MFKVTTEEANGVAPEVKHTLDDLARDGARRMIAAALEAEADEYVERMRCERDEQGHALVVRNGKARQRTLTTGAGPMKIRAPRVHDRRPGQRYTSQILPPYMRRSPRLEEVLPVLYLRGLSTGDFAEALPVLLGPEAAGLSATTITRLIKVWQDEYRTWRKRSLATKDYVYVWADGVYFGVRLEEDRLACLVVIGVLPDGQKELIALEDGYRESHESWAALLRDLKDRGMMAPVLAVGDGALGFWGALAEVYPETREQRCWVHKLANILDKLPKRLQPRAKALLHEVMLAPTRAGAKQATQVFAREFEVRYPKAVACLLDDQETLLSLYDFPAQHWIHLRTTNPIESPFATVKSRTSQTKGAGSRTAGLALAFKLALAAEDHWRKLNASELIPLVRAGVRFEDGLQIGVHPETTEAPIPVDLPMRIATFESAIHNI
jgi:transposase-like protein